jgi:hypothetical protein
MAILGDSYLKAIADEPLRYGKNPEKSFTEGFRQAPDHSTLVFLSFLRNLFGIRTL